MTEQDTNKKKERFAVDTNHLAEVRTSLARSRTYLAAERTFAAWIRTGFAISGVGVTLGTALRTPRAGGFHGPSPHLWYLLAFLLLSMHGISIRAFMTLSQLISDSRICRHNPIHSITTL